MWESNRDELTHGVVVNLDCLGNLYRAVDLALGPIPWERDDYQWNEISQSDYFMFAYLAVLVDAQRGIDVSQRLWELEPHYRQWLEVGYFGGVLNFDRPVSGDSFKQRFELESGYVVPSFVEALFKRFTVFFEPFHGEHAGYQIYDDLWNGVRELPLLEHLGAAFIAEVDYRREDGNPFFMDTQMHKVEVYKPVAGMFESKVSKHHRRFDEPDESFTFEGSTDFESRVDDSTDF
jgi:hypothetical protein